MRATAETLRRRVNRDPPPVFGVFGPTAVGKTEVAIALAQRFECEIVSVDSAMVYRRMDIGTGKPTPTELTAAPHALIDIREPHEAYSAAEFVADARRAIEEIRARGRCPLLAGGTGLYFKALVEGLADLPAANAALRARYVAEAGRDGWAVLHARLARVDPASAARIHPHDPQRIQRALEVFDLTGAPLTVLHAAGRERGLQETVHLVGLEPVSRPWLHERIERRFEHMISAGLVEEVAQLMADPRVAADLPSMRAVGYRQVWAYLEGRLDREEMVRRAVYATRQLAKRQLTWLRGQREMARVTVPDGDPRGLLAQLGRWMHALGAVDRRQIE